jgi:FAD:protein FMN transferase
MISLRRARPLLGTLVDITVRGDDEVRLRDALENSFSAVAEVQRRMSFHEQDSDLSRLNREAFLRPVQVAPETWHVLAVAQRVSSQSNGRFDITVASELVSRGLLPPVTGAPRPDPRAAWQDIDLLPDRRVRFRRPLLIDLGGIAKGFAVDRAVVLLRRAGITMARINAGGDMFLMGRWAAPVAVRHPRHPAALASIGLLHDKAIATSAATATRRGRTGTHVNPRDAFAAPRFASVSVVASTCVLADALTKVLMVGGRSGIGCLATFDATAFVVGWKGKAMVATARSRTQSDGCGPQRTGGVSRYA